VTVPATAPEQPVSPIIGLPPSPPRFNSFRRFWRSLLRRPSGVAGLLILAAFVVVALFAPVFIGPNQLDVTRVNGPLMGPPSWIYPLGTDENGRSILALVAWGARTSLTVGIIATVMTVILGGSIGLVAGHYQGRIGSGLMHLTDWFIALPSLPLAIALSVVLGQGSLSIIIAIAVTSWTGTARLVRAQTLAVGARPFIERAKALGAGNRQIMVRQVLPNVMPLILVSSILTIASAILAEATLTFLGLGDPTTVSWGSMLNSAFAQGAVTVGAWWYLLTPGIAIGLVVLGFTLTGRAIEHVINPRMMDK
jgi:peptide/nickel transport system permease protein